ncbi:MAG: PilW family protein [Betaproteobacteria bacterium]
MRARELGMSLVELLVAVAIGLIGILIITQAYLVGDNFNKATLGEGGAQTNGLVALYSLERDARGAGYGFNSDTALGCGALHWHYSGAYSIKAGGALPDILFAPVAITHDTVTPANPDKIAFLASSEGERMLPTSVLNSSVPASTYGIAGAQGFQVNDVVVLAKATDCTVLRVTSINPVSGTLTFQSSAPLNPVALAGLPTYASGDLVFNLGAPIQRSFDVAGGKLRVTSSLWTTGVETPEEIVDGVVDLRALYGKDTDNNNIVDQYDTVTPTTSAGWLQVQAVKIGLLARIGNYEKKSVGAAECDATTVVPAWSGSAVVAQVTTANPFQAISVAPGSEDRCYRYRVFETTVPLRNMIWRP